MGAPSNNWNYNFDINQVISILALFVGIAALFVAVQQMDDARKGGEEQKIILDKQQKTLEASRQALSEMILQSKQQQLESKENFDKMLLFSKNQLDLLNKSTEIAIKQREEELLQKSLRPKIESSFEIIKVIEGVADSKNIYPYPKFETGKEMIIDGNHKRIISLKVSETGFVVGQTQSIDAFKMENELWMISKVPDKFLGRTNGIQTTILDKSDLLYFKLRFTIRNIGDIYAENINVKIKVLNEMVKGSVDGHKPLLKLFDSSKDLLVIESNIEFSKEFLGTIPIEIYIFGENVSPITEYIAIEIIK